LKEQHARQEEEAKEAVRSTSLIGAALEAFPGAAVAKYPWE
jgi:hypothetical protein